MSDVTDFMNAAPKVQETALNSLYGGRDRQLGAQNAYYNNQKLAAQLPFVAPQEQASLQKAQLANQYYAPSQEADINAKNAQAESAMANADLIAGQAANLSQDQWAKIYSSSPDYAKPNMLAARQAAMQANPALAGTSAPGFNGQQTPQSSFAPQDIAAARQAQQSGMMPPPQDVAMPQSAMAGSQGKAPGLVPYNQTNAPQYQQSPPQVARSAMAGMPTQSPSQANNAATTLFTNTPEMQQNAALGQKLAVGDAGSRNDFNNDASSYGISKSINQSIMNNPDMINHYSGVIGANKFKYDEAKYGNNFAAAPPEYTAMKQLNDTYGKITPDALAKTFTNSGTTGNINSSAAILRKGFSPGSTEVNTLNAMTELLNLQAMKMQPKAQFGNMSSEFNKLTGADVNQDLVKNPIVADMTRDQALTFLKSKSDADKAKYAPGVTQMLSRQQAPAPQPAGSAMYAPMGVNLNG
jgi:hypothetical protein